jgi:iron complex transport system substrate-binding protein
MEAPARGDKGDAGGRSLRFLHGRDRPRPDNPTVRICSLLPSATEIVARLGCADALVGVSEECDWPPEVRSLPAVTSSRVDPEGLSSRGIDRAVRDALARGLPLYAVDSTLVEELEPDLILTQNLCAVCAVSADSVGELCAVDARVVAVDAHSLAEIEASILSLAELLGLRGRGEAVVVEMRATVAAVGRQVAAAPVRPVFVAEWLDPPFAAGHWLPEMVELAGGRDVLGRAGEPSFATTWDEVRRRRPELVVAAPCGFDHERAARDAAGLQVECPVVAVDSNAYYARPGPRVADAVAQLAHLFHPRLVADPGLPAVALAPLSA